MGRACGTYGGQEKNIQDFGGKTGGKRSLVRPKRRWEFNLFVSVFKWGQSFGYEFLFVDHLNFCAGFTKTVNII